MKSVFTNAVIPHDGKFIYMEGVTFSFDNSGIIKSITSDRISGSRDLSEYICLPGFCDFHSHFPQYNLIGIDRGRLPEWLEKLVYPTEFLYNEFDYAYTAALDYFNKAAEFGTTEMFVFAASSRESAEASFTAARETGIEAFIGNSLMDRNVPDNLVKTPDEFKRDCKFLCKKFNLSGGGRLHFAVTPRFAVACSAELMQFAGDFARDNDLVIQTHLAENKKEIEEVSRLFPKIANYTEVYDKFGLVTEKSLFAHGIYLSPGELDLIKGKSAAIIHCPSSNIHLCSGIMPAKKYLVSKIDFALGSDVGAGESLSMLAEIKSAIEVSKILTIYSGEDQRITAADAFLSMYEMKRKFGLSTLQKGGRMNAACFDKAKIFSNPNVKSPEDILTEVVYKYANNQIDSTIINGIEKK